MPLLLSVGFHVRVDIAATVEGHDAVAAVPLGPDERLTAIVLDRYDAAASEVTPRAVTDPPHE